MSLSSSGCLTTLKSMSPLTLSMFRMFLILLISELPKYSQCFQADQFWVIIGIGSGLNHSSVGTTLSISTISSSVFGRTHGSVGMTSSISTISSSDFGRSHGFKGTKSSISTISSSVFGHSHGSVGTMSSISTISGFIVDNIPPSIMSGSSTNRSGL